MNSTDKPICTTDLLRSIGPGLLAGAAFVLVAFVLERTIIKDLSGKL